MKNSRAVIPTVNINDAIKERFESSFSEYLVCKNRKNLFLTQTPQAFNLKEISKLHNVNSAKYKDDDISLYVDLNKVKFIKGEKNNFKITDQSDFQNLKNIYKSKQKVGIGFDVHRLVPKRNLYLGGFRDYGSIGHSYDRLSSNHGVNVVHDWAISVDTSAKKVKLGSGSSVSYDKLVLSPGIDIKYESINGYSPEAQTRMPHAWKSGTQVIVLRDQVLNMRKGGTFVMVPPPNPFRCPPGPYERVSMVAHLLKAKNPTGKIVVVDPKNKFSKQGLFMAGWEKHYPGMVEWIDADNHGGIKNANFINSLVDVFEMTSDAYFLDMAQKIANYMIEHFWNETEKSFYFTADTHESLIVRPKNYYDLSVPSGNSVAANALLKLHHFVNDEKFLKISKQILELNGTSAAENPFAFGYLLNVMNLYLKHPTEITIINSENSEIVNSLYKKFIPEGIIIQIKDEENLKLLSKYPFFEGKEFSNKTNVTICKNFTCSLPLYELSKIEENL